MTVWSHLPTIFRQRRILWTTGLLALCVALSTTLFLSVPAHGVEGINKTIGFQGRLQRANGGIVPDGYYNIQFKIYQDGTGTSEGNPNGTLKWTESYVNNGGTSGIRVKNGYFSVDLGSNTPFGNNVDWNQDALWISMNVAGSDTNCTSFNSSPCVSDGEMLPMKRMSSVPFALNSGTVGGKSAQQLVQLGQGVQEDAGTTSSIFINKTGSGNLLQLQSQGEDILTLTESGDLSVEGTGTFKGGLQVTDGDTNTGNLTVGAGKTLTLTGGGTETRPEEAADGAMYYDSDTGSLLVYSNGRWRSSQSSTSKTVAPSTASQAVKDAADYVADGTSDEDEINAALTAAAGGKVYLYDGTFTIDSNISVPNNTTLAGAGRGTLITIPNNLNATMDAITNTTQGGNGTGVVIQDLRLDGNKANQTSADTNGIHFNGIGSGTSSDSPQGARISNVWTNNWHTNGVYIENSSQVTVSNVSSWDNYYTGINATASTYLNISNSSLWNNSTYGLNVAYSTNNSIFAGNSIHNNGGGNDNNGIYIYESSDNSFTGNRITDTSSNSTNYAININDSNSHNNYFSSNTLGDGTIHDNGTNTILGGQTDGSANYTVQPAGNIKLMKNTEVAGTLSVSNTITYTGVNNGTGTTVCINESNELVKSNATSCTNPSSIEYKENVVTIESAQDKLGQLRAVSFDWKADSGYKAANGGNQDFGVIAQEVANVMPELVQYNEEGDIIGVNYTGFIPYLIAGAQEHEAEIKDLQVKAQSLNHITATNLKVQIGDGDGNGAPTLLTVDRAAEAPEADDSMLGSMYYDTTLGKLQCYEADGWGGCSSSPDTFVTLSPQYANAVMNGNDVGTISSDLCSDSLNINDGSSGQPTLCGEGETYNFYKWTSNESSDQTRSIYITYTLPENFKKFVPESTTLMGRTDNANANVTYQIYKDSDGELTSCGSAITVSTGAKTSWQKKTASGTADPADCDFKAGDDILFRINLTAKSNADALVSDLRFTFNNN